MPRVRALQSFAGHPKGHEFDLPEDEARVLSTSDLLGGQKVEIIKQRVPPLSTQSARSMTRAIEPQEDKESETPARRGRSNRRDIRPED